MRGASPSEVRSSTSVSDESRSATTIVRDSIASSPAGQTFSSTRGWWTSTPTGTYTNVLPADHSASARARNAVCEAIPSPGAMWGRTRSGLSSEARRRPLKITPAAVAWGSSLNWMPGRWSSVETSDPVGRSFRGKRRHSSSSPVGQEPGPKRTKASKRAWRSQSGSSRRRLCCSTVLGSSSSGTDTSSAVLANGALHLQGDQPIHFDGVVHRQRLDDRLDEAVHDHRGAFGLGETAAHEIEELLLADLRDRGLVTDGHIVLVNLHVGVGVAARGLVEDERIAPDRALGAVRPGIDLHHTAVGLLPGSFADALALDDARRVRRGMDHLGAGVLVLLAPRERDREHLAMRTLAHEVDARVLHGDLGPEVRVDPGHPAALLYDGALGHEVVDVVAPVLDGP